MRLAFRCFRSVLQHKRMCGCSRKRVDYFTKVVALVVKRYQNEEHIYFTCASIFAFIYRGPLALQFKEGEARGEREDVAPFPLPFSKKKQA